MITGRKVELLASIVVKYGIERIRGRVVSDTLRVKHSLREGRCAVRRVHGDVGTPRSSRWNRESDYVCWKGITIQRRNRSSLSNSPGRVVDSNCSSTAVGGEAETCVLSRHSAFRWSARNRRSFKERAIGKEQRVESLDAIREKKFQVYRTWRAAWRRCYFEVVRGVRCDSPIRAVPNVGCYVERISETRRGRSTCYWAFITRHVL